MGNSKKAAGLGMAAGLLAGAITFGAVAVHAAPNELRPFEGTFEGTTQVAPRAPAPGSFGEFTFAGAGTYQATHLGTGTFESAGTLEYARHMQRGHIECAFVDGELVLTAADGDQLNGDIDQDRSVLCQREAPQDADTTLYVEVEGGTGRFADATGWYFVKSTSIQQSPGNFNDTGYTLGSIDY